MKILLCGANGFIGRHIHAELLAQGHTVVGAGSRIGALASVQVDYAKDTSPAAWLARLAGVDVVINAVGVLRTSKRRPIEAVHRDAPKALFEAVCSASKQDGLPRRIIQLSALGIEGNHTAYASTKRAADEHLWHLLKTEGSRITGAVLRPSIVFGKGGESSAMFATLAKLPILVLPKPVLTAQVQPITVHDLARGVARLVTQPALDPLYECTGATALTLAGFIAALRKQQGRKTARVLALPELLTRISVRLGDQIPIAPWCSETLALLAGDNVSAQTGFAQLLGQPPAQPLTPLHQFWREAWL